MEDGGGGRKLTFEAHWGGYRRGTEKHTTRLETPTSGVGGLCLVEWLVGHVLDGLLVCVLWHCVFGCLCVGLLFSYHALTVRRPRVFLVFLLCVEQVGSSPNAIMENTTFFFFVLSRGPRCQISFRTPNASLFFSYLRAKSQFQVSSGCLGASQPRAGLAATGRRPGPGRPCRSAAPPAGPAGSGP